MRLSQKTKKISLGIAVLLFVGLGVNAMMSLGNNQGYAPVQPIPFSHKIHAGQNGIPCMYCHVAVEKSRHATVPSMNVCMNCHSVVKGDSPYIKKLKQMVERGETFEWIKVHDLPDFVQFNHRRHIAKNIACEHCHGDVKKMDVVRQAKPMLMGWCLDCHRGNTAPVELLPVDGKAPKEGIAPTDCFTCHH